MMGGHHVVQHGLQRGFVLCLFAVHSLAFQGSPYVSHRAYSRHTSSLSLSMQIHSQNSLGNTPRTARCVHIYEQGVD